MKRILALLLILLMLTPYLASCNANKKQTRSFQTIDYFDTPCSFLASGLNEDQFRSYEELFVSRLEEYHRLFDIYNKYEGLTNLALINEVAGKDFVKDPGLHRTMLGDGLACVAASLIGGPPVTTYSEVTGAISLTKVTDPAVIRIAALVGILFSVLGKISAILKTIPSPVLGGIMLLLFGTIASVGVNSLVKNKVDLGNTRNLVIASLILTLGIGGAEMTIGSITIGGIGLAALVGVILNLVIPKDKAQKSAE